MANLIVVLCLTLLCGICGSASFIPGGPRPLTEEWELTDLAGNLTEHLKKAGSENGTNLEFIKILSATSKVVAGRLFNVRAGIYENSTETNCTIELWEKPWENFVKIDVECGHEEDEPRKYGWASDQQHIEHLPQGFGGFGAFAQASQKELTDLHPLLDSLFTEYAKSNAGFDEKLTEIVSGESQSVAGTVYKLVIKTENPQKDVKTWNAKVVQNLKGRIVEIELTSQDKHHLLTVA